MSSVALLIVEGMMELERFLALLLAIGDARALMVILVTSLSREGGQRLTLESQRLRSWLDVGLDMKEAQVSLLISREESFRSSGFGELCHLRDNFVGLTPV
jgi:hypothetical protein